MKKQTRRLAQCQLFIVKELGFEPRSADNKLVPFRRLGSRDRRGGAPCPVLREMQWQKRLAGVCANSTDPRRLPGAPEYDGETKDQGWLQEVFHMAATVICGRCGEQPGPRQGRAPEQSDSGGCGALGFYRLSPGYRWATRHVRVNWRRGALSEKVQLGTCSPRLASRGWAGSPSLI